eukprot:s1578_g5.t1
MEPCSFFCDGLAPLSWWELVAPALDKFCKLCSSRFEHLSRRWCKVGGGFVAMVAAQDSSAKTGAVPGGPGVVESFYDFFAQIYSSSFTANRPWPTSFRGSTAPTEAGTSRTDGSFSGPENQLPHARNQPENQSPQHRSRFSMVPGTPQAAETRSHQPHPLEYGWPGEEIRTPQKPSKARLESPAHPRAANLPNPSAHVTPRGFPQQDLESTSGPSRTHVLREQKQRELREQREEAARQQEVILRQQQQELREQREQYLRQREEELWGKEEACPEPRQGDATPTPSRQAKALPQPPFQKRPEDRQPAQPHRNSQSDQSRSPGRTEAKSPDVSQDPEEPSELSETVEAVASIPNERAAQVPPLPLADLFPFPDETSELPVPIPISPGTSASSAEAF